VVRDKESENRALKFLLSGNKREMGKLAVRNLGREGLAARAISAVDAAVYDLKARIPSRATVVRGSTKQRLAIQRSRCERDGEAVGVSGPDNPLANNLGSNDRTRQES
jgi:hypothetical protein